MNKVVGAAAGLVLGFLLMLVVLIAPSVQPEPADAACAPDVAGGPQGPVRLPFVGRAMVTSNFGMRVNPGNLFHGVYRLHAGIDMAGGEGQQIVAAMAGRVNKVWRDFGGGNIVSVSIGGGQEHWYLHLQDGSQQVKVGDPVWPGRPIGREGSTGNVSGPHLHFNVMVGGKPTDPRPWMASHGVTIPPVGGVMIGPAAVTSAPTTAPVSSSASSSPAATVSVSSAGSSTGPVAPPKGFPSAVGRWRAEQLVNAGWIMRAARDLHLDARGTAIGVMTSMGESSLKVLDRGDAIGPDSRGLFQQRGNGAWGSYADRMDPYRSAMNFFLSLKRFNYASMAPTLAAHKVQANADANYYAPFWSDAVKVVAALSSDPSLLEKLPASGGVAACAAATSSSSSTGSGSSGVPASSSVVSIRSLGAREERSEA